MSGLRTPWLYALLCGLLGGVELILAESSSNNTELTAPAGQNTTDSPDDDPDKGIVVRRSGLRFFDTIEGHGDSPVPGEIVTVHYVASWANKDQVITREHYGKYLRHQMPMIHFEFVRKESTRQSNSNLGILAA